MGIKYWNRIGTIYWKAQVFTLFVGCLFVLAEPVRIYHGANRQGEIDPCGCQTHQDGGIDRLLNFFREEKKKLKHKNILLVDSGDTFFAMNPLSPTRREQELLKAMLIAKAYREFGVRVLTPGERDFAGGLEFLRQLEKTSGALFVSANLKGQEGALLFKPYHIIGIGNSKIVFIGLSDPEAFAAVEGVQVDSPQATLTKLLPEIQALKPKGIFLLSHLGLLNDRAIAKVPGLTGILGSHSLDVIENLEKEGTVWITQPQIQGQQIGVLDLDLTSPEKVNYRLVSISEKFIRVNALTKEIKKYKEKVRVLELKASKGVNLKASSDKPYVAQVFFCKNCHPTQFEFWKNTKHASAYLVLYAKNQHLDGNCIGCHSLGFEEKGGFERAALAIEALHPKKVTEPLVEGFLKEVFAGDTGGPLDSRKDPKRHTVLAKRYHETLEKWYGGEKIGKTFLGVQCEHCHGNRAGHPDPSIVTQKRVQFETCRQCHRPPNSRELEPSVMSKVACPLSSRS